ADERRIVVDTAGVVEHAAMAVVGELVEAQIGLHDECVTHLACGDTGRDVEDAVALGRPGAHGILVLRNPEEHDAADARLRRPLQFDAERVERVLHDARHGRDGARLVDPLCHEHRQHELRGLHASLRREATPGRALPEATRADHGRAVHPASAYSMSASMSDSVLRSSAITCTGSPAARVSKAVRGPTHATTVSFGSGASCSATCRATEPEVTSTARMRPDATSRATSGDTGTPTVR